MTKEQTKKITFSRPDDWHLHVREGDMLQAVIPDTARHFARAIIMPNLKPPITTTEAALRYREQILDATPRGMKFTPLMTLYLTDNTDPQEIRKAKSSGHIYAVKLYPAGATTHSNAGVTDLQKTFPVLEQMQDHNIPLLIHGESTDPTVDVFDRERVFIESQLAPLIEQFPNLRIVLEHVTTREAVDFVTNAGANVAGTITVHHLLLNRNAMFAGGIRPHYFCLPVLKREIHRQALVKAATNGNPKFFLGTDSAPHPQHAKESACGCAGIYSAHVALELYTEVFDQAGALDKLEGFASFNGADFYGLPRNTDTITLEKVSWTIPEKLSAGKDNLIPLRAGEQVHWRVIDNP
jgi:dihydroorotase